MTAPAISTTEKIALANRTFKSNQFYNSATIRQFAVAVQPLYIRRAGRESIAYAYAQKQQPLEERIPDARIEGFGLDIIVGHEKTTEGLIQFNYNPGQGYQFEQAVIYPEPIVLNF